MDEPEEALLRVAFLAGAAADAGALLPMLWPALADLLWGFRDLSGSYRFAMGYGASLMLGWTVLLLWASRRPRERRFVAATVSARILVTGAAGQLGAVGRTVTGLLLERGLPVRAMVRREDERRHCDAPVPRWWSETCSSRPTSIASSAERSAARRPARHPGRSRRSAPLHCRAPRGRGAGPRTTSQARLAGC